MAMEARILRPLHWFGLLEHRREAISGDRFGGRDFYRKSSFVDRFLRFDVQVERPSPITPWRNSLAANAFTSRQTGLGAWYMSLSAAIAAPQSLGEKSFLPGAPDGAGELL